MKLKETDQESIGDKAALKHGKIKRIDAKVTN